MSRRLRAFKRWMRSQGIDCSDAIEIVDSGDDEVISVRAVCDLREGDMVATIPKSACLTVRTSAIGAAIDDAGLGGSLALSVALMYERSLGQESNWHGYLQLLPEREPVPLVWSQGEIDELLVGTELHKAVKEDKRFLCQDWKESIEPLILSGPSKLSLNDFGIEQYFSAKTLVSSRSFEVDDYHGFGMVPLADLLNHQTGAEHVHFTSVSSPSSSDNESDGSISYTSSDDKSPIELLSTDSPGDKSSALEMIFVRDVEAGAEVFNTYGSMGNAALLHRYGFTELNNKFDIVNIDLHLVSSWCTLRFSNRYYRTRLSLWRRLNYSGCTSHNSEYFEISFDGEPQVELLILLYIIFLEEDAYEKLKYMADSFEADDDETSNMVNLIKTTKSSCDIAPPENANDALLTEDVCLALLSLADMRENLYGAKNTLEDDVKKLEQCCQSMRKLYHSQVLRVCERNILAKMRDFASGWLKPKKRRIVYGLKDCTK